MRLVTASLFVALLTSACSVKHEDKTVAPAVASDAPPAATAAPRTPLVPITGLPDFTSLVDHEGPAVVNISIVQTRQAGGSMLRGVPEDDPMFEFFRHFMPPQEQPHDEKVQSLGSGFIISADGLILTNAHVVDNADEVTVRLTDKREFKAKVIGVDKRTDVAVVKIPGKDLPTVNLGDSDKVKPGQWVIAIGSPFGFDNSVTAGIVSAKGRALPDESYVPFIQTDAAVNPGNSGGPLFNMNGEVIGINSQIYSRTGGYMGLSFAIPINVAVKVADQLRAGGRVSRGRLGVHIQDLSPDLAAPLGLKSNKGALVSEVETDSPAAHAGIRTGDVIVGFDGHDVASSQELPVLVGNTKPGSEVKIRVLRRDGEHELTVTLAEMPNDNAGDGSKPALVGKNKLGLSLEDLDSNARAQAGVQGGAQVTAVDGIAAQVGIQQGDILLAVNERTVTSAAQGNQLLASVSGQIALLVRRGDQTLYVAVTIPR